jgi:hypothetical protein
MNTILWTRLHFRIGWLPESAIRHRDSGLVSEDIFRLAGDIVFSAEVQVRNQVQKDAVESYHPDSLELDKFLSRVGECQTSTT